MTSALRSATNGLRAAADALASIFFPAPCRICGELLDNAGRIPICHACLASLARYTGPECERCGRPFISPVASQTAKVPLCHLCRRNLYDFDLARSYGLYVPAMARAIILLKYHHVFPLAGWFGQRLIEVAGRHQTECVADLVTVVPTHRTRLRERGYNHAELIGRPLARHLGLSFRPNLLVRIKPRPEKLRLTLRERWRTVRGAYAIRPGAQVDNLRVLLVDDVLTTGATLDACSRALRRAGAVKVVALTVARAFPPGSSPDAKPLPRGLD